MNASILSSRFRVVREAGEPLGLFFRPGAADHTVLKQLLSEGQVGMLGAVFDPCHCEFQDELRTEMLQRHLEVILDPGIMELATAVGHNSARQRLPWANPSPHVPSDFDGEGCDRVAEQIARFVVQNGFTAVLAPTHYLDGGAKDSWFAVDKRLVTTLRRRLDSSGHNNVSIYYPLATSTRLFIDEAARTNLKASLSALPIDALWLRIHPFGSESGDTTLRRYIQGCQHLHGLKIPLVAEKTGVLGLALLAFGAVAGIESGISSGEKFDYSRLKRVVPSKGPFARAARVYLPDLATFLKRKQAIQFFAQRGLRQFACRDTACCRHGHESMISDSRRHFANTRMGEVAMLSRITPSLRPSTYLEEILRPSTDNLSRALGHEQLPDLVRKKLEQSRRKQDGWRFTLGEISRFPIASFSAPIERRIHRERATA